MFDDIPARDPAARTEGATAPEAIDHELGYEAAFPYLTPHFVAETQAPPWPPVVVAG